MRCDDYELLISAAADGELDPAVMSDVMAHLDSCETCRREYEATVALHQELTSALARCGDFPSIRDRVMHRIAPTRQPLALRWAWSAVAGVIALAVITGVLQPVRHETRRHRPVSVVRQNPNQPPKTPQRLVTAKAGRPEPNQAKRPPKGPVHQPRTRPDPGTAAGVRCEAPTPVQQVEVMVEYVDETAPPAPTTADYGAEPAPPPGNWYDGKMVASRMSVIENGEIVDRSCYRLVPDADAGSGPGEGDM